MTQQTLPNPTRRTVKPGGIAGRPQAAMPQPAQPPPAQPQAAIPPPAQPLPAQPQRAQRPAKPAAPPPPRPAALSGNPIKTLDEFRRIMETHKGELIQHLHKDLDADFFVRQAINAFAKTPVLRLCSGVSVFHQLAASFQMGLTANGVDGEGWLSAFKNQHNRDEIQEAVFMPGYKGLVKIAYCHPRVSTIESEIVHATDSLEFKKGTASFLDHSWQLGANRGDVVAAYTVVWLTQAARPLFVILDKAEIDRYRQFSRNKDGTCWRDHYPEMAKKTTFLRLAKWLPKSPALHMALAVEDRLESGESPMDLAPGVTTAGPAPTGRTQELMTDLGMTPDEAASNGL